MLGCWAWLNLWVILIMMRGLVWIASRVVVVLMRLVMWLLLMMNRCWWKVKERVCVVMDCRQLRSPWHRFSCWRYLVIELGCWNRGIECTWLLELLLFDYRNDLSSLSPHLIAFIARLPPREVLSLALSLSKLNGIRIHRSNLHEQLSLSCQKCRTLSQGRKMLDLNRTVLLNRQISQ